ncbi:MAG TPA: TrmH family RNA methyltransferase [Patescibacteria group bacterium]|nr:TrmH family RNA methyltransferase [Patescibacteria group bacterium]
MSDTPKKTKLNARELRSLEENTTIKKEKRRPLFLILDSVYDTYNVGGLFRLADALNMEKIYLCGQTEIPPNHKIKKASIGTYKIVPWEYKKTAVEAIGELRHQSLKIIAIEQHPTAIPYNSVKYQLPTAFVVGNETFGISKETLSACDTIVEIPMFGINKSLNVIVAAAIVSYHTLLST